MSGGAALAILAPVVFLTLGLVIFQMIRSRPALPAGRNSEPTPPNRIERPLPTDPRQAAVIIGPPMVQDATLRDHVLHYSFDPNVWSRIGAALYEIGGPHPKVGPYFHAADMKTLPLHFTRMLLAVCHTGVSDRMLRTLTEKHARITNPAGDPIDDEAYDIVKSVIIMIITNEVRLPDETVEHLDQVLEVLRPAVVR